MLSSLCDFLQEQTSLQSCQQTLENSYLQTGMGVGMIAVTTLLGLALFRTKAKTTEVEVPFEYILTFADLAGPRKLPIQSLLQAYFKDERNGSLYQQYQHTLGKSAPALGAQQVVKTYQEVVREVLANLGLPLDHTYPEELKETDKNAEQIIQWALQRKAAAPVTPSL